MHPDVLPFSPQYPLWSDGAAKRRWIWLPPGTSIDASAPDAWQFPRGHEAVEAIRARTACSRRVTSNVGADGAWRFGSYVWNADGTDAVLAPARGVRDLAAPNAPAPATRFHPRTTAAPATKAPRCRYWDSACCNSRRTAIRWRRMPSASRGAVDLDSLSARGLLRNLPRDLLSRPPRIAASSPAERAALGYLHGNCGNCHNNEGPLAVLEMTLAQRVAAPANAPSANSVVQSIVGVQSGFRPSGAPRDAARIAPGHLGASVIALRMKSRDPLQQMPPLGTSAVDAEAVALLARWIDGLSTNQARIS